jgi:hypothetical protein
VKLASAFSFALHFIKMDTGKDLYPDRKAPEADPTESGSPSGSTTLTPVCSCVLNIDFLKVLELEGSNFPVILDVWSQVVERGAGQGCAATPTTDVGDLILKMEDDLLKNLTSGMGVLVALPLFYNICRMIISDF